MILREIAQEPLRSRVPEKHPPGAGRRELGAVGVKGQAPDLGGMRQGRSMPLAGGYVPQLSVAGMGLVIVTGRRKELSIGTEEPWRADRAAVASIQGLALGGPGVGVPKTDLAIIAAADQRPPVWGKGHGPNFVGMQQGWHEQRLCGRIPQPDLLVRAPRGQDRAVGTELRTSKKAAVVGHRLAQRLARIEVP